jgi:hypothetical protein
MNLFTETRLLILDKLQAEADFHSGARNTQKRHWYLQPLPLQEHGTSESLELRLVNYPAWTRGHV